MKGISHIVEGMPLKLLLIQQSHVEESYSEPEEIYYTTCLSEWGLYKKLARKLWSSYSHKETSNCPVLGQQCPSSHPEQIRTNKQAISAAWPLLLLLLPLAMNTFPDSSAHQFPSLVKQEDKYSFSSPGICGFTKQSTIMQNTVQ